MATLVKPTRFLPKTSPARSPSRTGTSPERSNPRNPITPPKLPGKLPAPGPERGADGKFISPPVGTDAQENAADERRERNQLLKFGDVQDAFDEAEEDTSLIPGVAQALSTVLGTLREYLRTKLLFQGNPRVAQRIAPFDKQGPGAQVAMGEYSRPSINRRIGGTGFGVDEFTVKPIPAKKPVAKKKKTDSQRLRR